MEEEIWKPLTGIPEIEGRYVISNYGRIRYTKLMIDNAKHLHFVQPYKKNRVNKTGYVYAQFWYGGSNHPIRLHRLVAAHFVENPNGYNEVNHIDGDKTNNHASNLEWCSHSQNNKHKFDVIGYKIDPDKHRWTDEQRSEISARMKKYYKDNPKEKMEGTYRSRHLEERRRYEREYAKKRRKNNPPPGCVLG